MPGMAAMMSAGGQPMPPGMQQPQQQQQQPQYAPRPRPRPRPSQYDDEQMQEEIFRPRYNDAPASNDTFGYGRPQEVAQAQPQVVQNTSGTVRQYSPADFANIDVNTLENLKLKGYNSRASIDSFNNAVQAAIAQKKLQQRQSPEPIFNYEPPSQQQPIIQQTTETTTTTEISTDGQTVSDLKEASLTEDNEELRRPIEEQENVGDIAEWSIKKGELFSIC